MLTGLAIVLVAGSIVYCFWMGISAIKLRRAYAALEADGRPMRPEEIIPPWVPETENAALLYESAILLLRAQPAPEPADNLLDYLRDLTSDFARDSLETDQRAELRNLLEEDVVTSALLAIRLGTERPTCRFDRDYRAGMGMRIPHLVGLRTFVRIVGVKAQFEAESGRPDTAWDLALMQSRLTDALRSEPVTISQLVRVAGVAAVCRTVQRLCTMSLPGERDYSTLENLLEELDDVTPLVRAFDGERLLTGGEWIFALPAARQRDLLKQLATYRYTPEIARRLLAWGICFKPLLVADHAAYLRATRELTELLERPYSLESIEAMKDVDRNAQRRHTVTRNLMPAAARIKVLHTEMMAEVHITRAGLALLHYRDAHGAFPESLDDLGLDGIDDPFSHQPLVYQPQADGFLLYSIGSDLKDNAGTPERPRREPGEEIEYDIVWRFPDQPTR
jgi:hypothetical protein